MKTLLTFVIAFLSISAFAQYDVKVEITKVKSENNQLNISYNITNCKPNNNFKVWLEASLRNGKTIKSKSVSGDVGENVFCGTEKRIVWKYTEDDATTNDNIYIAVKVESIKNVGFVFSSDKRKMKLGNAPKFEIAKIEFADENGNEAIDAGELCKFKVFVKNTGATDLKNVTLKMNLSDEEIKSLTFPEKTIIGDIAANDEKNAVVIVKCDATLKDAMASFIFEAMDETGIRSQPSNQWIKLQSKDIPLSVTWKTPEKDNATVKTALMQISACIQSGSAIKKTTILINDQPLLGERAFKPATKIQCTLLFEQKITLSAGVNKLQIIVENADSTITSETRTIILKSDN